MSTTVPVRCFSCLVGWGRVMGLLGFAHLLMSVHLSSLSDMVVLLHESSPGVCIVTHGEVIDNSSFSMCLESLLIIQILFGTCIMYPANNLPNAAQQTLR